MADREEGFYKVLRRDGAPPTPDIGYYDPTGDDFDTPCWFFFGDPHPYSPDEVLSVGPMVDLSW